MTFWKSIAAFGALLSLLSFPQRLRAEAPVFSLEECIEQALAQNAKLRSTEYDVTAAQAQLAESKALFWPVLEYKYRMAPVPTNVDNALNNFFEGQVTFFNSLHLGIGVPLTTFGQLQMVKQLAQGGVKAARITQRKEEGELILQMKQLYYGLQLAYEISDLLQKAIGELSERITADEKREEPRFSPIDRLKLKSMKVELEKRRSEIVEGRELAYEGLRVQMGLLPEAEFQIRAKGLAPLQRDLSSLHAYREASLKHRPEAQLLHIGVKTKERQYRLEKRKLLPKVGLGAFFDIGGTAESIQGLQATDDFNDPFNYKRAGVGLQLEGKFDFHGAAARIRKTEAEYFSASLKKGIAQKGLKLDASKTYRTAKRQQENVRRAKQGESFSRQLLFLAKSNLDLGVGERDEYVDALKRSLVSRGEYFQSVYNYNVALADLERVVGSRKSFSDLTPKASQDLFALEEEFDEETFLDKEEE